jgi:hypothetical protein
VNYIAVVGVTEDVARRQATEKSGYPSSTIGRLSLIIDQRSDSRQDAYIFETSNHVANHPQYAKAKLSEAFGLQRNSIDDGPILIFGPEVTVGG